MYVKPENSLKEIGLRSELELTAGRRNRTAYEKTGLTAKAA